MDERNQVFSKASRAFKQRHQALLQTRQAIVERALRLIKTTCGVTIDNAAIDIAATLLTRSANTAVITLDNVIKQVMQQSHCTDISLIKIIHAELRLAQQIIETEMIDIELEAIETELFLLSNACSDKQPITNCRVDVLLPSAIF